MAPTLNARELLTNQMRLVQDDIAGLGRLSRDEWLARATPAENQVGFMAWHVVATRDWIVRAMLSGKRPIGWDAPFAGSGIALCEIPFSMTAAEAEAICEATSPREVVAYSAAVTDEFAAWLASVSDSALDLPPVDGRAHLALSPRYNERDYRWQLEEDPDDMCLWPVWTLVVRAASTHCLGHLTEIEMALKRRA